MSQAKTGDTVKVHYTGTLDDGTVFDTSKEREPLQFKLGEKTVIEGFETAVEGMNVGETKNFSIEPDQAYGQYNDQLVIEVPRSEVPEHIEPEVGMMLQVMTQEGQPANVTVTGVSDDAITLDANHPLAGKTLNFEVDLVEVE